MTRAHDGPTTAPGKQTAVQTVTTSIIVNRVIEWLRSAYRSCEAVVIARTALGRNNISGLRLRSRGRWHLGTARGVWRRTVADTCYYCHRCAVVTFLEYPKPKCDSNGHYAIMVCLVHVLPRSCSTDTCGARSVGCCVFEIPIEVHCGVW